MHPQQPSEWRPTESPSTPAHTPPVSRGRPNASLAATLMAVALFGGIVGFAADRYVTGNPNSPLSPVAAAVPGAAPDAAPTPGTAPRIGPRATDQQSAATSAASTLSSDPQEAAIQAVIQKGDQEQQDAFVTGNASLMADTSTAEFHQEQTQTNADLKNNGVSAIKLINIEWGRVNVSGTTATATAWETWSTTYADGTTEQSRDRNEYTLVQDNGTWKISGDTHPDDPYSGTGTGTGTGSGGTAPTQPSQPRTPGRSPQPGQPGQPAQPPSPRPRAQGNPNTSQNWSGYAASGGTYTAVSGTWTVPQFSPSSAAGADAAWVGIGGTTSRDLIQAGTQQTVSGSGATHYEAWVEMLPQASHPVPLTVNPGDSVTVSITQQGSPDQWLIALTNNTTGQTFQVNEQYTSSMSSAEWIEEAPSALRGRQIPLDDFGTIAFSDGSAVKDGQTVSIAGAGAQAITMVGRGGQTLATPSALGSDGSSFSVTRG